MSFLYPLFLAGLVAVAVPILLHVIRRHTRRRVTFSSLMFLRPTMPRFKSRSRLEHIPLLILRCLIVCLLVLAFARPFLVRPSEVGEVRAGRRVVLLIDTSASMRRSGVWARALDEARAVLASAEPTDRLSVIGFDQTPRTLVAFEQWTTVDPAQRATMAAQVIASLQPTWAATDLGHAMIAAAETIEDDETNDGQPRTRQVVLISDLQHGSNLDAMAAYEWPDRMELVVKAVPCEGPTNASLQWITSRSDAQLSIRVTNSPDADKDRFQLRWNDDRQTDVYVPAGQSVVVHAPADLSRTPASVRLAGDDHDFDNALHLAPPLRRKIGILYIGNDDANDTHEMLYYVRRALRTRDATAVNITRLSESESIGVADPTATRMMVVTGMIGERNITSVRRYVESGGILLLVLKSAETAPVLASLAGIGNLECREAEAGQYAILDRVELEHPLLKPFADPRFGDFTRIHFWRHRRLNAAACPGARVLAWFDGGDPAWLEVPIGRGSALVLTSGWQPSDSDLALSSKFVPLLYSVLEYGGAFAGYQPQYFVGDSVPIPERSASVAATVDIRRPDNSLAHVDPSRRTFTQTDLPGTYAIADSAPDAQSFAVNLPAGESRTEPMPIEDLERRGIPLKTTAAVTPVGGGQRVQRSSFVEMESQQKLWRWVLVAVLIMLTAEVWLAGRLTRPRSTSQGEPT